MIHKIKKRNILVVGGDQTSNGGIASVIKSLYSAFLMGDYNYDMSLLKTNYYKDKGFVFELFIFIKAFLSAFYSIMFKNVKLLHIHSSAHISFYRKSFFIVLAKIFNKKIILHIHSSDFYDFFLSDRILVKKIINYCDCIIVLCKDWELKLSEKYPKKYIKKIENPFEKSTDITQLTQSSDVDFKVLFVGFFIESKGIRDILKLAKYIKENASHKIRIQLAGKGGLNEFILKTVEDEDLEEVVEVVGWVSADKKEKIFQEANALILPSYKEGMPISILEGMSFGLPIISTKIAGIPDVVTNNENGFLFEPGDIIGFYNGICALIEDLPLRKKMYNNNLNRVKENRKENIFKEINTEYEKLIKI